MIIPASDIGSATRGAKNYSPSKIVPKKRESTISNSHELIDIVDGLLELAESGGTVCKQECSLRNLIVILIMN